MPKNYISFLSPKFVPHQPGKCYISFLNIPFSKKSHLVIFISLLRIYQLILNIIENIINKLTILLGY